MTSNFNRRDFLKLAAVTPFMVMDFPKVERNLSIGNQESNQTNVIILVFDTLTANQMSLYGYPRDTTPNIARFAERATVFHSHYSTGNFTSPGTASIFTGAYPWSHRAINLHSTISSDFEENNIFRHIPDHIHKVVYTHNLLVTSLLKQFEQNLQQFVPTRELCLADNQFSDRLFPNDFNTSFWSEGIIFRGSGAKPSSLFLSLIYKLLRLSSKQNVTAQYGHLFPRGVPNLNDLFFVLEDAIDWLVEQIHLLPRPYLGYFHVLPPHEPYTTRADFVDIFIDGFTPPPKARPYFSEKHPESFLYQQRREYDEYLAYTDAEFGRLYDFLVQSGALNNTYVIITSDHGELFERGIRGHVTRALYEPLIHIPLIISKPGQHTREDVFTTTSCVDLLPTLLKLYNQPIPDWCEGEVLPSMGFKEASESRAIYAVESKSNHKYGPLTSGTFVIIEEDYKYIYYMGSKRERLPNELYDLKEDPEEMNNLANSNPSLSAELENKLKSKLISVNKPNKNREMASLG
jgi:arylsulfatase A-like enzyme